MTGDLKPDPSLIGGVSKAPLVHLPTDPQALFQRRAERFDFLAQHSQNLGPYLSFLGAICHAQAEVAASLPPLPPLDPEQQALAHRAQMPPIDRNRLAPLVAEALDLLGEKLVEIDMPEASRLALAAVRSASADDRDWLITNTLTDSIPADSLAPHLFVAAAAQVQAARMAAQLEPAAFVPIRLGVCPACGGKPLASVVTEDRGVEGARYAVCACCQTQWNEVRVKCLCCGSAKGLSLRSVEVEDASVKAEACTECNHWVKIFYRNINATIEPVADDVGSLGLDLMMKETGLKRGGFNPFLLGY